MISIVLPLYNKEKSIKRTIESILNQSYQNFELIIVNDGSTDSSYEIVKHIKSDKIRLFSKTNEGVSATRNYGIRQAKYEIIAFIDGDDIWLPNYLSILIKMINIYPNSGMYIQNFRRISVDNLYVIKNFNNSDLLDKYFKITNNFERKYFRWKYTTSSIAIKKELLIKNKGFDITLTHGEDLDLWFRIGLQTPVCYSQILTVFTIFYDSKYNAGPSKNLESTAFYKFSVRKKFFLQIKSNLHVKRVLNTIILYGATASFKVNNDDRFKFLFKFVNPFYLLSIKNITKYIFLLPWYIKKIFL